MTERLAPGRSFTFTRTFTEGDVAMFCGVTGDYNPFHLDEEFSKRERFGRRIVPGLLPGSMMTHIGGLLGVLANDMRLSFEAPVYIGDTVTCVVTVDEVSESGVIRASARMVNQDDTLVVEASFRGKPFDVRLAR